MTQGKLLSDPQPFLKRAGGMAVALAGLFVLTPAAWHLLTGLVTAVEFFYQQTNKSPAGGTIIITAFPILFVAYPLYWALALKDVYFLVEQITAILGIVILLKGLDLGGYEVHDETKTSRVNKNARTRTKPQQDAE